MNHLIDRFPEAVRIDGEVYPVNTDFRVGLRIMAAFEDSKLMDFEKQAVMCGLLFQKQPPDFDRACAAAIKFLDCGEEPEKVDADLPQPTRVYSFTKDAKYIYSAILQTHGVDLQTVEQLHWWKFCAMFGDLREDCAFQSIVSLRRRASKGKLTKEEKQVWYEMQNVLSLQGRAPDPERDAALAEFDRLMQRGD